MAATTAEIDPATDLIVENGQSHRVLLPQQQVRHRGGDRAGVLVLVQCPGAKPHRFAAVDQQRRPQVGVFLVLLDEIAVRLGPDLPVNPPHVVTGNILPVLNKLDRLAQVRAAVQTGEKALDDVPGTDFEPGNPRDLLRPQKSSGVSGHWSVRLPCWVSRQSTFRSPYRESPRRSRPRSSSRCGA